MATVILCVGSPVSFSDSIILPLACSSSALSIYIPAALPLYGFDDGNRWTCVIESTMKLQRLSDRLGEDVMSSYSCLSAG